MKNFTLLFFPLSLLSFEESIAQYQFLAPLPGSKDHNLNRSIIIREGGFVDRLSLQEKDLFEIEGSLSGVHHYKTVLCDDRKTILLEPEVSFSEGELVTVKINDGIRKESGGNLKSFTFSFETHPARTTEDEAQIERARKEVWEAEFGKWNNHEQPPADGPTGDDPTRYALPPIYITTNTNPTPGNIFFHNYNFFGVETGHHSIITNDGDSVMSKGGNDRGWDFKLNHNGYITMFYKVGSIFEMYDSSYNKVKTYKMGSGYFTDMHDFQLFPDGHYYLQAYDYKIMDLTVYDTSYSDNATVAGLVIQGFDASKNVVFEWRSWDHIEVIEAPHAIFTNTIVDYVHGNSIEEDQDGNIIISCRHLDQINKINVSTGEFMWRLGGEKNEFTFINDPEPFNYQHDARVLPNGNITLFDNGNYHTVPCSYAREYKLNLQNMTAKLVWSYKHPKINGENVIGWALGNIQRFGNGNTLINWGYIYPETGFPNITEVTPDGEIVWEMRIDNKYDDVMYGAHKYEWTPCARPTGYKMKEKDITYWSAVLHWAQATGAEQYIVQYRKVGTIQWWTLNTDGSVFKKKLNQLLPETSYEWRIKSACADSTDFSHYSIIQPFTTLPMKISSESEKRSLLIYPNPASNVMTVQIPMMMNDEMHFRMTDLLGQLVYQQKFEDADGLTEIKIPLENFAQGIYSVELKIGGEVWKEMVVVE